MRVRLYEVGSTSIGFVLRCDQFPARFRVDEDGHLAPVSGDSDCPAFQLEEQSGQILYRTAQSDPIPLVNGAPLEVGPLMPGDRVSVEGREFQVSYERSTSGPMPSSRFRIQS